MKRKHFRILLIVYLCIVVTGLVTIFRENSVIPSETYIKAERASYLLREETPLLVQITIAFLMLTTVLLAIGGFSGMFFFWGGARFLFALAVILKILLSLSCEWSVASAAASLMGGLETLFDGFIVSLVFWGNAKPLFGRQKIIADDFAMPIGEKPCLC